MTGSLKIVRWAVISGQLLWASSYSAIFKHHLFSHLHNKTTNYCPLGLIGESDEPDSPSQPIAKQFNMVENMHVVRRNIHACVLAND